MEENYAILGLKPGASWTAIRTAFKMLVFKYHPDKSKRAEAAYKFREVHEAFSAIEKSLAKDDKLEDRFVRTEKKSGPKKKQDREKESHKKEKNSKDPRIERALFLYEDELLRGCQKSMEVELVKSDGSYQTQKIEYTIDVKPGSKVGDRVPGKPLNGGNATPDVLFILKKLKSVQDPPKHQDLHLTEDELKRGVVRKVTITRSELQPDGTYKLVEKMHDVVVKPGSKAGDREVLERVGDQGPGKIPADIVFTFKMKDPPKYLDLFLTSEEFLRGITKKVKIKRTEWQLDGSYKLVDRTFDVEVKPYSKVGDTFLLKEAGDQWPATLPADIVFTFRMKSIKSEEKDGEASGNGNTNKKSTQNSVPEHSLFLTQEELLHGHNKKISIKRTILQPDGSDKVVNEIVHVKVKPGSVVGDKIELDEEMNRDANQTIPRIVFTVKLKKSSEKEDGESKSEDGKNIVQDPQINHDLLVTAEDLLHGCTKKMKVTSIVQQSDGSYEPKGKLLEINLDPGSEEGKTIRFRRAGDQGPNKIPADIVFTVKLKETAESKNVNEEDEHSRERQSQKETENLPQDPPIEYDLVLTPEELLNGCKKKQKIMRKMQRIDDTFGVEERTLTVDVKPDSKVGTKITLTGKGDHVKGKKPTDVVYILKSTELKSESDRQERQEYQKKETKLVKDPPIEREAYVTSADLLKGCTKKYKVARKVLRDGSYKEEEVILEVLVKQGSKYGDKITLKEMGDEAPNKIPADIVFTIKPK